VFPFEEDNPVFELMIKEEYRGMGYGYQAASLAFGIKLYLKISESFAYKKVSLLERYLPRRKNTE